MDQSQISFDLVGFPLGEDIYSEEGLLLLKKGTLLKEIHILLLQKYRFGTKVAVDLNAKKDIYYWKEAPSKEPYKSFPALLKETFQKMIQHDEIELALFKEKYHDLIDLALCDLSILEVLQLDMKVDERFYQHSLNVGILSALIGKILGFNRENCLLLAEMGLFHNIGLLLTDENKTYVESGIFNQLEHSPKHTEQGYKLLKSIPDLNPAIPLAALHHHERLNGSGYPSQRKNGGIPFYVQIISVADSFNLSRMNEPAGEKNSLIIGVHQIMDAARSNLLNPGIVIPFVQYIMRQILHEKVKLNNGEEAQILFIHANEPHQPLIKLQDEFLDLRKKSSLKIESLVEESVQSESLV